MRHGYRWGHAFKWHTKNTSIREKASFQPSRQWIEFSSDQRSKEENKKVIWKLTWNRLSQLRLSGTDCNQLSVGKKELGPRLVRKLCGVQVLGFPFNTSSTTVKASDIFTDRRHTGSAEIKVRLFVYLAPNNRHTLVSQYPTLHF